MNKSPVSVSVVKLLVVCSCLALYVIQRTRNPVFMCIYIYIDRQREREGGGGGRENALLNLVVYCGNKGEIIPDCCLVAYSPILTQSTAPSWLFCSL